MDGDFKRFWAGQTLSAVGTQVTAVALPLTPALTLDAGAAGVSAIATASYLPSAALPLLAGHWLERRRKRGVMIATDVFRAAAVAVIPVAWAFGQVTLPLLVAVAFLVGAASVVFDIASFAYLPDFVAEHELPAANRALQVRRPQPRSAAPACPASSYNSSVRPSPCWSTPSPTWPARPASPRPDAPSAHRRRPTDERAGGKACGRSRSARSSGH